MKIDFLSDINKDLGADLSYEKVDRYMTQVLLWHFGVFAVVVFLNSVIKLASFYPSPLSWRVISIPEAVVSLAIALVAVCVPLILIGKICNHYLWRVIVTASLVIYSYLFVFISGGSIEMHFHFFMIAALLVIYADWRLGWILLVLTGLHHGILNYVEPGWVYYYGRNDFSVIAHALPVLVMVIFTTVLSGLARQSVITLRDAQKGLQARTNELEILRHGLAQTVDTRTDELKKKADELKKTNDLMVDRELKMIELKKEIAALKGK